MTTLAPYGPFRALNINGNGALAGGLLYTYTAGTTTPKATYTDASGLVTNANPVVLDANGYANVWLGTGYYKFVLTDSTGVTQYTQDNITGGAPAAFGSQIVAQASNLSVTSIYANSIINCSATLTLSLPASATVGAGFYFVVNNISASGVVTFAVSGADTIDRTTLSAANSGIVYTDGLGAWWVGLDIPDNLTLPGNLVVTGTTTSSSFIPTSSTAPTNGLYLPAANNPAVSVNGVKHQEWTVNNSIYTGTDGSDATFILSKPGSGAGNAVFQINRNGITGLNQYFDGTNITTAVVPASGGYFLSVNAGIGMAALSSGAIVFGSGSAATGYTSLGDITLPAARSIRAANTDKATMFMNGTPSTPSTTSNLNISGVVKNSAGNYTASFVNALTSANYIVNINACTSSGTYGLGFAFSRATGGFTFITNTTAGVGTDFTQVDVRVIGG